MKTTEQPFVEQVRAEGGTNADAGVSRRQFLKAGGGLSLSLSLSQLGGALSMGFVNEALAAEPGVPYVGWEDLYRREWTWDKVTWGSHTNVCFPGNCSLHVYTRNGIVWREEQAGRYTASNADYPDFNPQGCQKGCSFNNNLYGNERVKYPLKRVGERGEGKWKRISWDEALTDIADAILDAHQTHGTSSVVLDAPHAHGGQAGGWGPAYRYNYLLAGSTPDTNLSIGDFYPGFFQTMGKMANGHSVDNYFDAGLIIMANCNWSYTAPGIYHFITEARYNGAEVAIMAPDLNPSTPSADIHVPVKVGTDPAFWLGMCQVMISEGLYDEGFVKEQTDLALLVRTDTRRFLRASDVDGGAENQLYFYDQRTSRVVPASRATLAFDGDQALEGRFRAKLKDGREVEVRPAFALLRDQLDAEYTPEKASQMCGVHPSLIRELGRKMAKKTTCTYTGNTSGKSYHGDLNERSLLLATALSGNWGKPGTGFNFWTFASGGMEALMMMEKPTAQGGLQALHKMQEALAAEIAKEDPTATDEIATIKAYEKMTSVLGDYPPSLWLYHHVGFKDVWNNPAYQDPAMKRSFTEYLEEAVAKGWWGKQHLPLPADKEPQVLLIFCHNPLRRTRTANKYPEVLFPKLKMLFAIEPRMSSSAMYCDIVLPAAWYYEKPDINLGYIMSPSMALIEQAVAPIGEAKQEWEIFSLILKKVAERAEKRGMTSFTDHAGATRQYAELYERFTMGGQIRTQQEAVHELVEINKELGVYPKDYTYEKLREDGHIRLQGLGGGFSELAAANEYDPKKPFYSLRWHVEKKKVYPTYTRRAQFYIDHEWFLELGEEFPVHKDTPDTGGKHPFRLTSGHPRVSVHSMHLSNEFLLRLHRGQPIVHINDKVAAERGIKDGDLVRMYNDVNASELRCRVSASVAPEQVIVYMWEPYQYKAWKVHDNMLVGQPKALQFAGGYEQIGRFHFMCGSPTLNDRGVRVDVVKA